MNKNTVLIFEEIALDIHSLPQTSDSNLVETWLIACTTSSNKVGRHTKKILELHKVANGDRS